MYFRKKGVVVVLIVVIALIYTFLNFTGTNQLTGAAVSTQDLVIQAAPTVTITTPTSGANFSSGAIPVRATVSDDVGIVNVTFAFSNGSFPFNRTDVGNSSGTWQINLDLSTLGEGYQNITVFANDTDGNVNSSQSVNITIDRTGPIVFFTSHRPGEAIWDQQIFTVNATDYLTCVEGKIIFEFNNGSNLFNATSAGSKGCTLPNQGGRGGQVIGTVTINTTPGNETFLPDGNQTIRVYSNDSLNNMNLSQNITLVVDNRIAPTVNITAPGNNSFFSLGMQNFTARVLDAINISVVIFQFNNISNPFNFTASNSSGTWNVSVNVSLFGEGRQGLRIFANDTLNNVNSSVSINFTIDRTPPTVNITSPANGATLGFIFMDFNATINDSSSNISTVIFEFISEGASDNRTTVANGTGNCNPPSKCPSSNNILAGSGIWNFSQFNLSQFGAVTLQFRAHANDSANNKNFSEVNITIVGQTIVSSSGRSGGGTSGGGAEVSRPAGSAETTTEASRTATTAETTEAFQSGQASVSIIRTEGGESQPTGEETVPAETQIEEGLTAYVSEQHYKVIIVNNFNKRIVLSADLLEELPVTLPNEENVIKRIKEELLLEGEVDEAAVEKELGILKLLENIEVLQVYKTKLSHLLPASWVSAAVPIPIIPTGKHIEANLLKDILLNAPELQNIEVNPGKTLEKEIKIRQGLRLSRTTPLQIIFSSSGEKVLVKNLEDHPPLVTGTAVDINPETKKLDFYIVIAPRPEGGKEIFNVEMNINKDKTKETSILLPFWKSEDIFSDLYGPYIVNMEKGALLAVQYDVSALPEEYQIVGKVYRNGLEEVAENHFEIGVGK